MLGRLVQRAKTLLGIHPSGLPLPVSTQGLQLPAPAALLGLQAPPGPDRWVAYAKHLDAAYPDLALGRCSVLDRMLLCL